MTAIHSPDCQTRFRLVKLDGGSPTDLRFTLAEGVCVVGRGVETDFRISSGAVSKRHARLIVNGRQLLVEDFGSTNGTYVNGVRVQQTALVDRDMVQFADALFRIELGQATAHDGTVEQGLVQWAQTLITFDTLLSDRRVVPHYQPIVTIDRISTRGYEVLARSNLPEFASPAAMFGVAERLGQQAALSELMRSEGIRVAAASMDTKSRYYLNTHPDEVINDRLIKSIKDLRSKYPAVDITIEIHEAAVTEIYSMREFRALLSDLQMQLAYDDFGAGQGRLLELADVPPDVLKFDMQLIRDIDKAPAARQDLLRSLVRFAVDLGTEPLAEGVETESEHQTCVQLGFTLGQGYLYGKPAPAK